jgi:hypothetical protein
MFRINKLRGFFGPVRAGPVFTPTREDSDCLEFNYSYSKGGYLILHDDDARLLLDTGAPISFGKRLEGTPGVAPTPPQEVAGLTTEWLADKIGCHIDGVIGAEVLLTKTLHIDPVAQRVRFTDECRDPADGIHLRHMCNVPIVDVTFGDAVIPTIFDTGAPLGFVPKHMTRDLAPIGVVREFYPFYGWFDTDRYELPVRIENLEEIQRFGVLPDDIEKSHEEQKMPTIIGTQWLENYAISIGHREQRIWFDRRPDR